MFEAWCRMDDFQVGARMQRKVNASSARYAICSPCRIKELRVGAG